MSKEYVWPLEVEGEIVFWKCVVQDNECVTYEGDQECKRLKIMNPKMKRGVLQIDTVTRVFDEVLPFQLENGIPYLKIEGKWTVSETTRTERLEKAIRMHKRNSYVQILGGLLCILAYFLLSPAFPTMKKLWSLILFGAMLCASGIMTLINVQHELETMGMKFTWKL